MIAFKLRLLVSVVAVVVAVGTAGWLILSRDLKRSQIHADAAAQRADARGFEAVANRTRSMAAALAKVDDELAVVGRRPGTVAVLLVDRSGIIRAARDRRRVGSRDPGHRIGVALQRQREYTGHDTAAGADVNDFEFVEPVRIQGRLFAYVLVLDDRELTAQLAEMKRALLLTGVLLLLGGSVTFYLLGGRALMRSHRYALERATRDGLTELPNQRAFQDDLPQAIATAARHREPVALALLDVDDFKHLNDRHGHPFGDKVLRQVAAILRAGRAGDRAYRIGGDEFALILPHTDSEGAALLGRRLSRSFREAGLRASIGMSSLRLGESAETLKAEADAALYDAKRQGGDQSTQFDAISEHVTVTRPDKLDALRRLLEHGDLDTDFQPIWDLDSADLVGLEALARPHPRYDFTGPAEAFEVAEQLGRVHDLDVLCMNAALTHVTELPAETLLFLNIHPQTLDIDADRNQWLSDAIKATHRDPHQTVIEVTERFGGRANAITKCLRLLRREGFKLALDDVGTGNSGLEMLRHVQAEYVKIDGGIVAAATADPNARAVLLAMATYARQTGAYVIAEGIEDEEILTFLRHLEVTQLAHHRVIQGGQGFTLGEPAPEIATSTPQSLRPASVTV